MKKINNMCKGCKKYLNGCQGCRNEIYTGCIFREVKK